MALAAKRCFDPCLSAQAGDTAPPLLLCRLCSERVTEETPSVPLEHITQPLLGPAAQCQNKGCTAEDRQDCIRPHGYTPLRLCAECDKAFHPVPEAEGGEDAATSRPHLRHTKLPSIWDVDLLTHKNFVVSIVKLLGETTYMLETGEGWGKGPKWLQQLEGRGATVAGPLAEERRLLSRQGIWMLAGLAVPREGVSRIGLGHMMAMIFHWFATTALLPNDASGTALELLKTELVTGWIRAAMATHFETERIREGLGKILALIPYDLISFHTWDRIMPFWLEAICQHVPRELYNDIKVQLCKLFEVDMSALPFEPSDTYNFVRKRLEDGNWLDQQRAVDWLVLLSEMDILIPAEVLLDLATIAAKNVSSLQPETPRTPITKTSGEAGTGGRAHIVVSVASGDSMGDQEAIWLDEEGPITSAGRPLSPILSPEDSPFKGGRGGGAGLAARLEAEGLEESSVFFFADLVDVTLKQLELAELESLTSAAEDEATTPGDASDVSRVRERVLELAVELVQAPWRGTHICSHPDYDEYADCNLCQETTIFHELLEELIRRCCPSEERVAEATGGDGDEWTAPDEADEADTDDDLSGLTQAKSGCTLQSLLSQRGESGGGDWRRRGRVDCPDEADEADTDDDLSGLTQAKSGCTLQSLLSQRGESGGGDWRRRGRVDCPR